MLEAMLAGVVVFCAGVFTGTLLSRKWYLEKDPLKFMDYRNDRL
jgi:uncharacterized protein YneF (UPF0154 family)